MSDANRVQHSYRAESTWATPPSGAYQIIRATGSSVIQSTRTVRSQELRSDRQLANTARTGYEASGPVAFELSAGGSYDDWLLWLAQASSWTAGTGTITATTLSFAAGDNSINDSANGFSGFGVGEWVTIYGSGTNRGIFRIHASTAPTAGKIIFDRGTVTTEAAGASITMVEMDRITNGTTAASFTLEKDFQDLATAHRYERAEGCYINSLSLRGSNEAILTGEWGLIGKKVTNPGATLASSYPAATTTPVMGTVSNAQVYLAGVASTVVSEASFEWQNNIAALTAWGSDGAARVRHGAAAISGSITALYEDSTEFAKFLAFSSSSVVLVFYDQVNAGLVIEIPQVKFTQGARNAPGINQDVVVALDFDSEIDATLGKVCRIWRS